MNLKNAEKIRNLESQIEILEADMFLAEMGDDFYFTNGRREMHLNRLMELKKQLKRARSIRSSG